MKKTQNKLSKFRQLHGLTQSELAAEIKFPEDEISKIEFDEIKPTYKLILQLVERYPSINLNWWFKGEGIPFHDYQDKEFKDVPYPISEVVKREHFEIFGDSYRDALEDFLKIEPGSKVRPRHLLKTDLNAYEYDGKFYLVVKKMEIHYLVKERILKCLWLAPKNLLSIFLKDIPLSKKEQVLDLSSRL
jgi:transcriptional regulator with XRE-family HTH domain